MRIINKAIYTTGFIAVLAAASSFIVLPYPEVEGNLTVEIQNYVGTSLLKLDSVNYQNEAGQLYTISKFKYYIGNIHLKKTGGSEYISDEYFLIDEENEASEKIVLKNIPAGSYDSIDFILGVDSLHNCSGAQSGALDPVNGMFWAWNTGYIFLKIEGHSPASKSAGHIFEFHIGGYKEPANCIRHITLGFKNKNLQIASGKNSSVLIKADASRIFKAPVAVDFSKISSVTDFHNAAMIADNYADIFSILAIEK